MANFWSTVLSFSITASLTCYHVVSGPVTATAVSSLRVVVIESDLGGERQNFLLSAAVDTTGSLLLDTTCVIGLRVDVLPRRRSIVLYGGKESLFSSR